MKRLVTIFIMVPIAVIVLALAVANRGMVTLAVPPQQADGSYMLSADMPLFAVVLLSVLLGMVIGSCATWVKQGRHRRIAQERKAEAAKANVEARKLKEEVDANRPETGHERATRKLGLPAPKKAA